MEGEIMEKLRGFNPRVLAGGRDIVCRGTKTGIQCFNPRVLAGGRDLKKLFSGANTKFQSTRPRGRTRRGMFRAGT